MWGARGAFPTAAAMVVAVVTPVVLCAKATEKSNKNTKISCLLQKKLSYSNTYIVKHIVIHILLIVAGLSPTPPPNEHLGLFWREKYPKFVLNATIGVKIPTH
jgi:hypothetical protein